MPQQYPQLPELPSFDGDGLDYTPNRPAAIITLALVTNPFVYGEVVPTAAFADRVVELDRLIGDLAAAQKVFLISPRRYGKSSLIRQALTAMDRRGALTVQVTVASFSSYVAFLEGYARALVSAETAWDRARAWLRDAIASTRTAVGADARVAFPNA